jgi:hypothetical protein
VEQAVDVSLGMATVVRDGSEQLILVIVSNLFGLVFFVFLRPISKLARSPTESQEPMRLAAGVI